jgi:hypothetical protein
MIRHVLANREMVFIPAFRQTGDRQAGVSVKLQTALAKNCHGPPTH